MKTTITITALFLVLTISAQSTFSEIYEIFQAKCISCHNNSNPQNGLDLEGAGASPEEKAADVYSHLVGVLPSNEYASEQGYYYIAPGRTDKSFLFRKISSGLEETIIPDSGEMEAMPPYGNLQLNNEEKELIRQWILYGAPLEEEVVDRELITDFYTNGGLYAFPEGAPEAPGPGEGFQIKMGPFLLEPGGEEELFTKYQLNLPEDIEVHRMDIKMADYSHHFILYDYDSPENAAGIPDGLRDWIEHPTELKITATVQEPTDLILPEGTAFFWDKDLVLDLNSHYINYSAILPYLAEVYLNVYTQPSGTAAQEMQVQLIPNYNIYIPNNGTPVTHTASITFPAEIFVWVLGGHTHRYGTGYKIWQMTENGAKGDILYDGACPQGIPGCPSPFFDYQHIPPRYFEPMTPVDLNLGLIHEASWINDGPQPVAWGPTSQDEMMLFGVFFVADTTGLNIPTRTSSEPEALPKIKVFPNPTNNWTTFEIPKEVGPVQLQLFDSVGQQVYTQPKVMDRVADLDTRAYPGGVYFYRVIDEMGRVGTGKLVINHQ